MRDINSGIKGNTGSTCIEMLQNQDPEVEKYGLDFLEWKTATAVIQETQQGCTVHNPWLTWALPKPQISKEEKGDWTFIFRQDIYSSGLMKTDMMTLDIIKWMSKRCRRSIFLHLIGLKALDCEGIIIRIFVYRAKQPTYHIINFFLSGWSNRRTAREHIQASTNVNAQANPQPSSRSAFVRLGDSELTHNKLQKFTCS